MQRTRQFIPQRPCIPQRSKVAAALCLVVWVTALSCKQEDRNFEGSGDGGATGTSGGENAPTGTAGRGSGVGGNGAIDGIATAGAGGGRGGSGGSEAQSECGLGLTTSCWEAPDGSPLPGAPIDGIGRCRLGQQTCLAEGVWSACVGAVPPGPEDDCEIAGDDADCNGIANEGCGCEDGEQRACGSDTGNCQSGQQRCEGGVWTVCEGEVLPAAQDSCAQAGDDADCNGVANEGCGCVGDESEPCGDCGVRSCEPAQRDFGECVGQALVEECWETEAGVNLSSEPTTEGNCRLGERSCQADGTLGPCIGAVGPTAADSCDIAGDDTNCNGQTNDGCACTDGQTRACGSSVGNCEQGQQSCENNAWSACVGEVTAAAQDSCQVAGDDADCNGIANENCPCIGSESEACGDCGTRTCNPTARAWGACQGSADSECTGADPTVIRTCSASGNWVSSSCQFACIDDACGGQCATGDRRCQTNPQRIESCNAAFWTNEETCPTGAQCSVVNGAPVCKVPLGGSCSDDNQCASSHCVDGTCCSQDCPAVGCDDYVRDCVTFNGPVTTNRCNSTGNCRVASQVCADAEIPTPGEHCEAGTSGPGICDDEGLCVPPAVQCGSDFCATNNEYCCLHDRATPDTSNFACEEYLSECNYDNGTDALLICDGPSDCEIGDICCSYLDVGSYYTTCTSSDICEDTNGVQICANGQASTSCPQGQSCQTSSSIPGYWECR